MIEVIAGPGAMVMPLAAVDEPIAPAELGAGEPVAAVEPLAAIDEPTAGVELGADEPVAAVELLTAIDEPTAGVELGADEPVATTELLTAIDEPTAGVELGADEPVATTELLTAIDEPTAGVELGADMPVTAAELLTAVDEPTTGVELGTDEPIEAAGLVADMPIEAVEPLTAIDEVVATAELGEDGAGMAEPGVDPEGDSVSVTGHTVVDTGTITVVRTVDLAGQLMTVGAQLVMVATDVEKMVDVVKEGDGEFAGAAVLLAKLLKLATGLELTEPVSLPLGLRLTGTELFARLKVGTGLLTGLGVLLSGTEPLTWLGVLLSGNALLGNALLAGLEESTGLFAGLEEGTETIAELGVLFSETELLAGLGEGTEPLTWLGALLSGTELPTAGAVLDVGTELELNEPVLLPPRLLLVGPLGVEGIGAGLLGGVLDVEDVGAELLDGAGPPDVAISATGQTVVDSGTAMVLMTVELAGQLVISGPQLVMVT